VTESVSPNLDQENSADPWAPQRPWLAPVAKLHFAAFVVALLSGFLSTPALGMGLAGVIVSVATLVGVLLAHGSRGVMFCFLFTFFLTGLASSFQEFEQSPVLFFAQMHVLGIAGPLRVLRVDFRRRHPETPMPAHRFSIAELLEWTAWIALVFGAFRWFSTSPHLSRDMFWQNLYEMSLGIPAGLAAIWTGRARPQQLLLRACVLMLVAVVSGGIWVRDPAVSYILIVEGTLVAMSLMIVTYTQQIAEPSSAIQHCSAPDSGLT